MRARRRRGVIMHAIMARKSVVLAVINMHLSQAVCGQRGGDGALRFFGHKFIFSGNMNEGRRGYFVRLAQHVLNADAVIGGMGIAIGAAGGQINHAPAEAKADCADFGAAGCAQIINGGLNIGDALIGVIAVHQGKGLLPFCLRAVGQRDIALLAPKQIGRQRQIALTGQPVGGLFNVGIDAENFLNDDNAALWRLFGMRQIGVKICVVNGNANRLMCNLSHYRLPFMLATITLSLRDQRVKRLHRAAASVIGGRQLCPGQI